MTARALKLAVLERHGRNGNIGKGWVAGFGPLQGAIASSVGHDSHNLIVAGDDEADMAVAVNHLIELQGGAVVVQAGRVLADLPLPVAGLMSDRGFAFVEQRLRRCAPLPRLRLHAEEPLLQLAFLPLPVIPHLKLTDRGYVAAGPDGLRLLPPRPPARRSASRRGSGRWPSPGCPAASYQTVPERPLVAAMAKRRASTTAQHLDLARRAGFTSISISSPSGCRSRGPRVIAWFQKLRSVIAPRASS